LNRFLATRHGKQDKTTQFSIILCKNKGKCLEKTLKTFSMLGLPPLFALFTILYFSFDKRKRQNTIKTTKNRANAVKNPKKDKIYT